MNNILDWLKGSVIVIAILVFAGSELSMFYIVGAYVVAGLVLLSILAPFTGVMLKYALVLLLKLLLVINSLFVYLIKGQFPNVPSFSFILKELTRHESPRDF